MGGSPTHSVSGPAQFRTCFLTHFCLLSRCCGDFCSCSCPVQVCAVLQRNGIHGWCSTGPVCPQSPGGFNLALVAAGAWPGGCSPAQSVWDACRNTAGTGGSREMDPAGIQGQAAGSERGESRGARGGGRFGSRGELQLAGLIQRVFGHSSAWGRSAGQGGPGRESGKAEAQQQQPELQVDQGPSASGGAQLSTR